MFKYLIKIILGTNSTRKIKSYSGIVNKINSLESEFEPFDEASCKSKTEELQHRLKDGETLDDILPEAFALVRKAAMNTLGQRHFDVQLIGGITLHEGQIAEMKTGEGKTLTSTLPLYLNALSGKGVHVVTVNDYLASRDASWMGEILTHLGLTVGVIVHGLNDEERRAAYNCDITYGTNNEYGFDFLRDNMKFDLEDYVQRRHHFAIVDEVDSILIDEARTPLIISGPSEESTDKYLKVNNVMAGLTREIRVSDSPDPEVVAKSKDIKIEEVKAYLKDLEDRDVIVPGDYNLDEKSKNIQLSEGGVELMESRLKKSMTSSNLYDFENIELLHHVNQALKAKYVFKRDVDYVVQDGKVTIVDEFTGRLMEGRRFSDGLHQALEAKEHVQIQKENQTLASITFQNYFRKYKTLAGMTGTAETEETEFMKIYGLGVVVVPTNKPMIRNDSADVIYKTHAAKIRAIVNQIKELHQKKQPILVGTASIESSENLSKYLKKLKIPHNVLNAKQHEKEAQIIQDAGKLGSITIATNMAGRGTDIQIDEEVKKLGGLFILGTERHESRRIDNQLRGRSGRQGDAGDSRFFLSLEDDLLRIFGGERIANLMNRLKIDEDEAIEHVLITKAIESSQKKVEGHNFEIRKHLLEYDDVMNRQRDIIYKQRKEILSDEVSDLLLEFSDEVIKDLMEEYVNEKYIDQWDLIGFQKEIESVFQMQLRFSDDEKQDHVRLSELVDQKLQERYERKKIEFAQYQKVIERQICLEITDNLWKEHLLAMDHLKEGIGLRSFAQKNPLDEYKKEGYALFSKLMSDICHKCVHSYFHIQVVHEPIQERRQVQDNKMEMIHGDLKNSVKKPKQTPVQKQITVKRNDPCPCGSGKKYKHCHMRKHEKNSA